ncbi:HAD family hydrolase, partial [Gaiella sp.]|uniref:HAD family hydrolase n=1 Tax=Gaiella sp. TaxID=2663207 RepID=UPI003983059C
ERFAGLPDESIVGGWLGVDGPLLASLVADRVATYGARAGDGSTVPGAIRDAVRHAADRVPVAVVSAAYRAEIEPVVAAAGLRSALTTIVAADDVEREKPDPACYLLALERLGLTGPAAVAFEDTEAGVAAAKAAGIRCIAVRGTMRDARLVAADEIVDAIDIDLVDRLLAEV